MRNRQANGLSKSGRYKAEDTARLKYIHCTGFPLIQKGLLPLPHDIHMLELGALETLRGQDKVAPRSAHRPPTLSPNLGTAAPLPLAQVAGSPSTITGTIDQLEMQIDPNSSTVTETSRKRGSRGGRTDADRLRDWKKNRTPEQIEKGRQKDRDRKKAKRGEGGSG